MNEMTFSDFKNKKTALVLSGGVIKAASWHLGVALALEELGFSLKSNRNSIPEQTTKKTFEISTYVGSSAGAMICLYLALGYTPQEIATATLGREKTILKGITYKDIFYLKRNQIKSAKSEFYHPFDTFPPVIRHALKVITSFSGFFSTEGIRKYILDNIINNNDTFEEIAADLFIVATQLDHSRKVIFSKYNYPNPSHDSTAHYYTGTNLSDAVTASMSVPPFFSPYPVKNSLTGEVDYYIDGEIRETLSTHVAEDNGCELVISSWTHTPYHYHDEVGSLINYGLPSICVQSILLMIQKKIISSRARRATGEDIINTVGDYMKNQNFTNKQRRDILSILEKKLNIKQNVKFIDIYPEHSDYKLFFSSSFSLSPKLTSYAVKAGYKRTMDVFSKFKDL